MKIQAKAFAKINLNLKVFEKMPSGFHRVETLMQKVGLWDDLDVEILAGEGIEVDVAGFPELNGENNLVFKAIDLFQKKSGKTFFCRVGIQKNIFQAAGLGGGSADAACILNVLKAHVGGVSEPDLLKMAATLGSDVPFLYLPCTLGFGRGRGEDIQVCKSLPPKAVLLVHPGQGVSTPACYKSLGRTLTWEAENDTSNRLESLEDWSKIYEAASMGNDLETPAKALVPKIGDIKNEMLTLNATFTAMSGSGSTVFGLFDNDQTAKQAYEKMKPHWPNVELTTTL